MLKIQILFIILLCSVIVSVFSQHRLHNSCFTLAGRRGDCIYLRSCPSLYKILLRVPLRRQDRVFLQRSQCGWLNNQPLVCCSDVDDEPKPTITASTSTTTTRRPIIPTKNNRNQMKNTRPPIQGTSRIPSSSSPSLPKIGVCGISPADDRIIGGIKTQIDEFTWMALLQYSKSNNRKGFHCGGVLINEQYVITAAHCVVGKDIPKSWKLSHVRLGEWDTSKDEDCVIYGNDKKDCTDPVQDIAIEHSFPHQGYDPHSRTQLHDIALLRLDRNVQFTDFISPICLPLSDKLRNLNSDGNVYTVSGWGKTDSAGHSDVKLKVKVTGTSLSHCAAIYRKQNVHLENSQVCAGGEEGFDSCRGDSGGPLMAMDVKDNIQYWYLAGVVSFGPSPCGQEGWPGVYTRIGAYIDWIEENIRN